MKSPVVKDLGGFSFPGFPFAMTDSGFMVSCPCLLPAKFFMVTFDMKRFYRYIFPPFVFVFLFTFEACVSHDFPEYECSDTYTFSQDIQPIIEIKCAISGCHNGDLGSDYNWLEFDTFHKRAESGLLKFSGETHPAGHF